VFENRALRITFGSNRDKITGEWRKLHNEELNDLYFSPNTFWVTKSKLIRWVWHVPRVGGEERRVQGFGAETWGK
jgi:hypothetical protein